MKKVLVIGASQSGQLDRILDRFAGPLATAGFSVDRCAMPGFERHPFPWSFWSFFDVFPEAVLGIAPPPGEWAIPDEDYDLVVFGYQVWFLSPSLPVASWLGDPRTAALLAGRPVVAVVACRNMWLSAWTRVRARLAASGARVLDHVVFTDRGSALASFITTPRWLLTGRRDRFLGLAPAGVDEAEIAAAGRFGGALARALAEGRERGASPLLGGLAAARVDARLALSERAGSRAFALWSRLVRACGKPGQRRRRPALLAFVIYLIALILTVVPLSLTLQTLLAPLFWRRFARIRAEFEAPSGSGRERLEDHV